MSEKEKQEWRDYFSFLNEAVGDSPHSGDDETMEWYYSMTEKLKNQVLGEE